MDASMTPPGSPPARMSRTLDIVAKLADIAWPVMALEDGQGVGPQFAFGQARCRGDQLQKLSDEIGNILPSFRQGWYGDRHDCQSVIEVFTKAT